MVNTVITLNNPQSCSEYFGTLQCFSTGPIRKKRNET